MSRKILFAALTMTLLAGCATAQNQRGLSGALVGAGTGAVAGQLIGRNTTSTVAGAAGGALVGAAVGTATTSPQNRGNCRYRQPDGTIIIARC
ncbi:glycine zipper 2TM domain-containing protein (plasmid) [Sinorhizobium meliloti WSM1022]|jgi:hypothetical protein|uniref:17 kDa surface antigen n=1 Tax=Rhizobium meliloti TaxID=382 RepID=A0A6A7ZSW4_RHIML|nr:glycine zipper 2TM domain-containing protein [Sinorhizobium meliloti]AGA09191.1 17 kDa surface antigen [Sinorhizobium meliloti GR4]ASJ61933.1 hypothetical protein SMB554_22820 [Sinorhizobium meliloti]ASQ06903.1 glycine zipper 2TM domain-containing protein [Sinorhizobium meliloti]ASQ12227.1 glycine zipper 2TM domain-containing protein [Sinorhizobium meliloti]MCK3785007.1 glycine zipper 2TM domain-containing protein [Sinorhizobium meliloti]